MITLALLVVVFESIQGSLELQQFLELGRVIFLLRLQNSRFVGRLVGLVPGMAWAIFIEIQHIFSRVHATL